MSIDDHDSLDKPLYNQSSIEPLPNGTGEHEQRDMRPGVSSTLNGRLQDTNLPRNTDQRIFILHEISAALAKAITLEEVAAVIIDRVLSALGAHHGAVAVVAKDGKHLELLKLTNLSDKDFEAYRYTPIDSSGPMTDTVRMGAPVWLENQEQYLKRYPHYQSIVRNITRTEAAAALPLRIRSQIIGSLMVSFPAPRRLTSDELEFLETIADYCAQSIERAQLYEAEREARAILQTRVHQQSVIAALGQQALSQIDLNAFMQEVVEQLASTLDVEYTKILEIIPGSDMLLLKAGVGWKEGLAGYAKVGTEMESQAGYTLASSVPIIVEDLRTESRFNGPALLHDHGVISGMSVIIQTSLKPYGVLGIHSTHKRKFTQDDIHFLQAIANILGSTLERDHLDKMLEANRNWLASILDTVPGIIWENRYEDDNDEMKLAFISGYVETMLGYTATEALEEPHFWFKILHPEDAQNTAEAFYRIRRNHVSGTVNFRALHKNGQVIDVQALMKTVVEDGKAIGKRGVMMDVSERQRLLKEQARYAELLKRSNEELRQFAYAASHDLQEPLRTVVRFMQLLESRYATQLDDDAREFIGFAVDGATRMKELIDGLLTYSRIERADQEPEAFDAQIALNKALANLMLRIEETGAVITHDELPVIKADSLQITQLFQNLITNAMTYRREGPPQIHIHVTQHQDEVQFAVQDNGIGIAPEFQKRIFVIFQRLHTREQYPGTGIGLAICKKVVERHGGRIWVESNPGEGATFYFTIPR
jgi:PAS domain S-box-containing protein